MHGLQNDAKIEIRDLYVFDRFTVAILNNVTRKVHNRKLSWWLAQSVWKESSFHFFCWLLPILLFTSFTCLFTYLFTYLFTVVMTSLQHQISILMSHYGKSISQSISLLNKRTDQPLTLICVNTCRNSLKYTCISNTKHILPIHNTTN